MFHSPSRFATVKFWKSEREREREGEGSEWQIVTPSRFENAKTNEIDRGMWTLFTLAMQFTNARERFSMCEITSKTT